MVKTYFLPTCFKLCFFESLSSRVNGTITPSCTTQRHATVSKRSGERPDVAVEALPCTGKFYCWDLWGPCPIQLLHSCFLWHRYVWGSRFGKQTREDISLFRNQSKIIQYLVTDNKTQQVGFIPLQSPPLSLSSFHWVSLACHESLWFHIRHKCAHNLSCLH